jgi:hypothetical protein
VISRGRTGADGSHLVPDFIPGWYVLRFKVSGITTYESSPIAL